MRRSQPSALRSARGQCRSRQRRGESGRDRRADPSQDKGNCIGDSVSYRIKPCLDHYALVQRSRVQCWYSPQFGWIKERCVAAGLQHYPQGYNKGEPEYFSAVRVGFPECPGILDFDRSSCGKKRAARSFLGESLGLSGRLPIFRIKGCALRQRLRRRNLKSVVRRNLSMGFLQAP